MTNHRTTSTRTKLAAAAVAAGLVTAAVVTATPPAVADSNLVASRPSNAVQRDLDRLVKDSHFPATLAAVRDRDGRTRNYTAGAGDLKTKAKVPVDGQVRIASNTKTFVATVVLQLVGEGKIALDEPIEKYLPGMVRGKGIDANKITVRQLLQHTSGLADYDQDLVTDYLTVRHTYFEPRELVDVALAHGSQSAPGTKWSYSNTNYIIAGLLVQKVTGRPLGEEITKRVINRIGLQHTYWPATGDQTIREDHPKGYWMTEPGKPLVDVTEQETSLAWAAGALISTPSDLNKFFSALIGGKLLKPAQLEEMLTTVEAPDASARGAARYGLGIQTFKLSCGGFAWSHGGDAPGYETRNAITTDGRRQATVAVTTLPTTLEMAAAVENVVDAAICR
ncbi:class A beta-lactamase-related serine hydrolase [Kribbella antibiotica]|uniref:Class A beta-lactamase-related serine hydrolase n=1 Tax=Kribbella antibiotica TaxID=190195 RepID=A0A4R4ZR51_9ACTN|nr:serine hydrolase domain-containing protein [Kribbella antibiotica]TDD61468.1 class A beta-lactamase-related serine hydrolase [Kribbella antibiotica]